MKIINKHPLFDHVEAVIREHYRFSKDETILLGYLMCTFNEVLEIKKNSKKLIILQLEQVSPHLFGMNKEWLDILFLADEIWDYDRLNEKALWDYGLNVSQIVKFNYTKSLDHIEHLDYNNKDIDVLFYGALNPKRNELLNNIRNYVGNGSLTIANCYGKDLADTIARSKIILNCHHYETDIQEQVRIFYPLCNGSCVVSEYNTDNKFGANIFNIKRHNIPEVLRSILKTDKWIKQMEYVRSNFKCF